MTESDRTDLARRIFQAAHITGEFLLRSGTVSHEYFDKYLFEADPKLLADIGKAMAPLVPEGVDVLAGLEMGAIPIVTMLSQETGIPAVFVRKKAKEYGTCKLAEGGSIEGENVLVIEDVVTSGGQVVISTADLRERGAVISQALCVIDREAGGGERMAGIDLALSPLFTITELKAAASSA
jgi:orotate phosphoribosyltransferase